MRKGRPKDTPADPIEGCMLGSERNHRCGYPAKCVGCGWNKEEFDRRRSLPLTKGEDGLRRRSIHKEDQHG